MLALMPPSSERDGEYYLDYLDGLRSLRYVRSMPSSSDLMLCDENEAEIFSSLKVVERLKKRRVLRLPGSISIGGFGKVKVVHDSMYYEAPMDLMVMELDVDTGDFTIKV
jgi:hypothetical protein